MRQISIGVRLWHFTLRCGSVARMLCKKHTAPRAFNTCHTRIFFSCARGSRCLSCVVVFTSHESHSISSMFHHTLLEPQLSPHFSTPFRTLAPVRGLLFRCSILRSVPSTSTLQGGVCFGRLAEQSPLTCSVCTSIRPRAAQKRSQTFSIAGQFCTSALSACTFKSGSCTPRMEPERLAWTFS